MARDVPVLAFTGLANASAAVALDRSRFVLADDEEQKLFLFNFDHPDIEGVPIPLHADLGVGDQEPDLEGAAMIGDRIWWITSHNVSREDTAARRMLFFTDIDRAHGDPSFRVGGHIHRRLLDEFAAKPGIAKALGFGGKRWRTIDIEGLATTPRGGLMLGFRTPLSDDRAVVVKIKSAEALARGEAPELAEPIFIELGGRGIRSLEQIDAGYLLVAGPREGGRKSKLFFWTGRRRDAPVSLDATLPKGFNPEAVFERPGTREICVISDDGRLYRGKKPPPGPPRFRAILLDRDKLLP
jgi:hypothetical protein